MPSTYIHTNHMYKYHKHIVYVVYVRCETLHSSHNELIQGGSKTSASSVPIVFYGNNFVRITRRKQFLKDDAKATATQNSLSRYDRWIYWCLLLLIVSDEDWHEPPQILILTDYFGDMKSNLHWIAFGFLTILKLQYWEKPMIKTTATKLYCNKKFTRK